MRFAYSRIALLPRIETAPSKPDVKELGLLAKGTELIIDLTSGRERENEGRGDERDVEVAVSITAMEQ